MTTKPRRSGALIGVAIAAALVTGCGSKVAATGASGPPPVLHLAAAAQGEATAADAIAPAASGGKFAAGYGAGDYVLKADLPPTPDGAKVYRPDAVTEAGVRKLAKAFGITDPVTKAKHGFTAGPLGVSSEGSWLYGGDCAPGGTAEYCPANGSTATDGTVISGTAVAVDAGSGTGGAATCNVGSAKGAAPNAASSSEGGAIPPSVDCPQASGGGTSGSGGAAGYGTGAAASSPPNAASKPSSVPGSGPAVDPGTINTSTAPTPPDRPVGVPEPTYTPPPVATDDVTRKASAPIISALGLVSASVQYGQVIADPTIDGLRVVGATTNISVKADGTIDYASGRLLDATAGATYPLISAKDAFAQLPPRPVPMMACAVLPGTPTPCPTFPPPVVTDVALGLTYTSDETGALLVPAWLFTVQSDAEPTAVTAVQAKYIGAPPTPPATTIGPASAIPPVAVGSAVPGAATNDSPPVPPDVATPMPASYPAARATGEPVPNTKPSAVPTYGKATP